VELELETVDPQTGGRMKVRSKLNLVDLAGWCAFASAGCLLFVLRRLLNLQFRLILQSFV